MYSIEYNIKINIHNVASDKLDGRNVRTEMKKCTQRKETT
jgi:hypothetical protein